MKILLAFLYISWTGCMAQTKDAQHPNDYLSDDVVKIRFSVVLDWPFIDGEINGVKGKWMFDTGNSGTIALHTKKVSGVAADTVGSGFVGSGQQFKVLTYPEIAQIKVGNEKYYSLQKVRGITYDFLEAITPEVIGQVGFAFFEGYDLEMDYRRGELTFYKHKPLANNWVDVKKDKRYITSLPYSTRNLKNIPMITIRHGGVDLLVTFDTGGGKGSFAIEDSHFERWMAQGLIKSYDEDGETRYDWKDIKVDDRLTLNLYGLDREESSPANKTLQITEKNTLSFDHSFLSQYLTIWDTRNKVIHVLQKQ